MLGEGEGVEASGQRSRQQQHKGVFEAEAAGSAKHRVFQDMGDACRVGRRRTEGNAKALVLIIVFE